MNQNRALIRVLTAVTALLFASFFFWPREGSRLVGRWNDYVGLAFATIFVQYLLRFVELKVDSFHSVGGSPARALFDVTVYGCSALNNLFFLA
ncbi:MAG TPA: hypothetical protein VN844_26035, partial [Pyrinomonadaceae bacterium]|nr:hypothetical protein [Pyrinomonadaceae bacterium]